MIKKAPSGPKDGKIKVIVTGATGMVGEGVLYECLLSPAVESVLAIARRPIGVSHPKLTELVHSDLTDVSAVEQQLEGYDACYFCLGTTSVGMNEEQYTKVTYGITLHIAETVSRLNPGMVFCYVTAEGTDNTEKGRSMWARVKGKTENDLLKLPFKRAYMFRPGYIHPTPGLRNAHKFYKAITWLYPALRRLMPKHVITLRELGQAMIQATLKGSGQTVVDSRGMAALAQAYTAEKAGPFRG
ncbi:NAD-dependent epimerase/dehydratase family protein [Paenibacillus protaetiae]|uniref:NAD-dependent epimerase/dehydratase family protein n=1 Tax=Paenibacillus protaetiae TaxID=2509456 RepID=A0A4V0YF52_9BACL|nr:NAD-dependent epimerase/dehydratase family protein [Paenibacillus protaetiae]QAY66501.1 NAD-dependent epimerase/dehydratase family protein [Paenibacillus protaetiae]